MTRCALRYVAVCAWMTLSQAPVWAGDPIPAKPADPAAVMKQIESDLDLQTKLPGDGQVEPSSDFKLRIPAATKIMWIAIAIGVAFALFALKDAVPGLRRRSRADTKATTNLAETAETAERMLQSGDDADELARLGRIAEAMHLLLLRSLAELRRRLGIDLSDSLTSREILQRLTVADDGRQALADLIRRVEFAHFGAKPTQPEDYGACRTSYERLVAAMVGPSGSAAA